MTSPDGTAANLRELLASVEEKRSEGLDQARPRVIEQARRKGKLTARERLDYLCDPDSFLEWGALAEPTHDNEFNRNLVAPGDAVITGSAIVDGRPVAVSNMDASILGGSMSVIGGAKLNRSLSWALERGHPYILLAEGGGHRIQDGLNSRHFAHGGGIRAVGNQLGYHAALSGWVPTAAAMMGAGFAGPANFVALCDFAVMVRGTSLLGMAGPALVKAGTGEEVTAEALGGWELQTDQVGVVDLAVDSDIEALDAIRVYLSYFPSNAGLEPPVIPTSDPITRSTPELRHIVPSNLREPYDVRRVVESIADKGSVFELRPTFAGNLVTTLARIGGRPVGVIANQPAVKGGVLDSPASDKGARFIAQCDAFGLALLYLVDVPGFLIGSEAERASLIKHSSRLVWELGQSTVPRLSLVMRKGYGLAYYAMASGRSFGAEYAAAFPQAEICAMSIEGAVDVAYRNKFENAEDPEVAREALIADLRTRTTALRASEGFGIDDVIDPAATRSSIGLALSRIGWRRPPVHPTPNRVRPIPPL